MKSKMLAIAGYSTVALGSGASVYSYTEVQQLREYRQFLADQGQFAPKETTFLQDVAYVWKRDLFGYEATKHEPSVARIDKFMPSEQKNVGIIPTVEEAVAEAAISVGLSEPVEVENSAQETSQGRSLASTNGHGELKDSAPSETEKVDATYSAMAEDNKKVKNHGELLSEGENGSGGSAEIQALTVERNRRYRADKQLQEQKYGVMYEDGKGGTYFKNPYDGSVPALMPQGAIPQIKADTSIPIASPSVVAMGQVASPVPDDKSLPDAESSAPRLKQVSGSRTPSADYNSPAYLEKIRQMSHRLDSQHRAITHQADEIRRMHSVLEKERLRAGSMDESSSSPERQPASEAEKPNEVKAETTEEKPEGDVEKQEPEDPNIAWNDPQTGMPRSGAQESQEREGGSPGALTVTRDSRDKCVEDLENGVKKNLAKAGSRESAAWMMANQVVDEGDGEMPGVTVNAHFPDPPSACNASQTLLGKSSVPASQRPGSDDVFWLNLGGDYGLKIKHSEIAAARLGGERGVMQFMGRKFNSQLWIHRVLNGEPGSDSINSSERERLEAAQLMYKKYADLAQQEFDYFAAMSQVRTVGSSAVDEIVRCEVLSDELPFKKLLQVNFLVGDENPECVLTDLHRELIAKNPAQCTTLDNAMNPQSTSDVARIQGIYSFIDGISQKMGDDMANMYRGASDVDLGGYGQLAQSLISDTGGAKSRNTQFNGLLAHNMLSCSGENTWGEWLVNEEKKFRAHARACHVPQARMFDTATRQQLQGALCGTRESRAAGLQMIFSGGWTRDEHMFVRHGGRHVVKKGQWKREAALPATLTSQEREDALNSHGRSLTTHQTGTPKTHIDLEPPTSEQLNDCVRVRNRYLFLLGMLTHKDSTVGANLLDSDLCNGHISERENSNHSGSGSGERAVDGF